MRPAEPSPWLTVLFNSHSSAVLELDVSDASSALSIRSSPNPLKPPENSIGTQRVHLTDGDKVRTAALQ
jgi:hypothetical protein